jgi:hypothetical protein
MNPDDHSGDPVFNYLSELHLHLAFQLFF